MATKKKEGRSIPVVRDDEIAALAARIPAPARPWPVGLWITAIRPMTEKELRERMWDVDNPNGTAVVICLSDGASIYPSQDPEGNGPGAIFIMKQGGEEILVAK